MIRYIMVLNDDGHVVYSKIFDNDSTLFSPIARIGAVVSGIQNTFSLLTGDGIRKIRIEDEVLLLHSYGKLLFVMCIDNDRADYERQMSFFVNEFLSLAEIDLVGDAGQISRLVDFNPLTQTLEESGLFP